MKIASALEKLPDVYIIEDPALNAFATVGILITRLLLLHQGFFQILQSRRTARLSSGMRNLSYQEQGCEANVVWRFLLGTIVILAWYAVDVCIPWGSERRGRKHELEGVHHLVIDEAAVVEGGGRRYANNSSHFCTDTCDSSTYLRPN